MGAFIANNLFSILSLGVTIASLLLVASRIVGKIEAKIDTQEEKKDDKDLCLVLRSECRKESKADFGKLWKNYDKLSGEFRETRGELTEGVANIKESNRELKDAVAEVRRANNGRK